MTDFTMKTDADGVAIITWDTVGKSMNVMNQQGFIDLDALIDQALADEAIKGIIITSGKDGSFAGGMDLNIIAKMKESAGDNPAQGLFDGLMQTHAILRKIERAGMDPKTNKGGKPIAAALPGTALGIGLEIPLACHRIFAADNPKAKIGLPEIMVGIFPGAGGTTRLTRKLGAMAASPFLLEGKLSDPKKAKCRRSDRRGRARRRLLAAAKEWVLSEPKIRQAMGRKGLQNARRRALSSRRFHDLRRGLRHGQRQDPRRVSRRQGAAVGGLRRRAGALRHRAEDRGALVHQRADEPVLRGHDPLAVHQQGSAGKRCQPPRRPRSDASRKSASWARA